MKFRALILTEGGAGIGFGHITRCLALSDALAEQGALVTLVVNGDDSVRSQFGDKIDFIVDWLRQKKWTNLLFKSVDIVVIDSYLAPLSFYKKAGAAVTVPVYIDDFIRVHYPPGIIVNGGIGAERFRYPVQRAQRRLLGAKYAIVRKDFWEIPPRKTRKMIRNALVSFGGMDRAVFINGMLECLQPKFPRIRYHVVTARPHRPMPRGCFFYHGLSAKKMKQLMLQSDLAISGGGQTTNELAACGLPAVAVQFAENQRRNLEGWQMQGSIKVAGVYTDSNIFEKLANCIRGMTPARRQRMTRACRVAVDGKGALRIADAILDGCFRFEAVTAKDRRSVFKWSNDPVVRAASFSASKISWTDHCRWFKSTLADPLSFFYKACFKSRVLAQARFKRKGAKAIMSISVLSSVRGRGFGARVIRLAVRHFFARNPKLRRVDAFIKTNNRASVKAFKKAGFRRIGRVSIRGHRAYHFRRNRDEKSGV